jgi:plastocyanin
MKRLSLLATATLVFVAGCSALGPTTQAKPQTFTVLVGAEDVSNAAVYEGFFPATIHVHAGDTVKWKLNTKEIHTASFLAGEKTPDLVIPVPGGKPTDVMIHPYAVAPIAPKDGKYDGTTVATSGLLGADQGQSQEYALTFSKTGTYSYVCLVHSPEKMIGTVIVDDASVAVPTQAEVDAQAKKEMDALAAQVPALLKAEAAAAQPDQKNADGTMTHYVNVGYSQGQIDLMNFSNAKLNAKPGDTVVWTLAKADIAPHTITALNGGKEPDTFLVKPQPNGPPQVLISPDALMPINADKPLSNSGVYHSGFLDPSSPGPKSFSLKVGDTPGDISYICILHDVDGMKGTVTISK